MKVWIVILILFITSCTSDNPLLEVDDCGVPAQTYPSAEGNYCYIDIVASEVRENIPQTSSFPEFKTTLGNIKTIVIVNRVGDTSSVVCFDKYRNVLSFENDSVKYDYQYKFDITGRLNSKTNYINNSVSKDFFF